jgi:hypothetical protein
VPLERATKDKSGGVVPNQASAPFVDMVAIRVDLGYKVLGFLFILFILAYLMKKEYWKDVKYGKWRAKD